MQATRGTPSPGPSSAVVAKGALRRLAQTQQEPTPENYARAYAEEAGLPPPPTAAQAAAAAAAAALPEQPADVKAASATWAVAVERLAKNLDRGGRQWTNARRRSSLNRVLDGSRSDPQRLLQRLQSLMSAWESDHLEDAVESGLIDVSGVAAGAVPTPAAVNKTPIELASPASTPAITPAASPATLAIAAIAAISAQAASTSHTANTANVVNSDWASVTTTLESTVRAALPQDDSAASSLADQLGRLGTQLQQHGATAPLVAQAAHLCEQARRYFGQRHQLVDQLSELCHALTQGMTELAEDDSWAKGQCASVQARLAPPLSVRAVRAARAVLTETRERQARVRDERNNARQSLQQLIHDMVLEVGELGSHTGRFQTATAGHAQAIASASSLEDLAGVVKSLLDDSRAVQSAVSQSQARLSADQERASGLEAQVRALESELRRLSEEVSTDALTQVANRRGLAQAFDQEVARCARESGAQLAVGLIDIDNFKKLNDSLGHAAGDVALKTLAQEVRTRLRPIDHLARFGGEEFVVLLPATDVAEAQRTLTRLQRGLTEALFLHEGREVFVTFSGGVTAWQRGESLDAALERADSALYEAKRTGKNRTCIAG
jgi:diguanylate cyclase